MTLYETTALFGSIMTIIFLVIQKILNVRWQKRYLIVTALCFVLPFAVGRYFYYDLLYMIFPFFLTQYPQSVGEKVVDVTDTTIFISDKGIYVSHPIVYGILIMILFVAFIWGSKEFGKYLSLRKKIKESLEKVTDDVIKEIFQEKYRESNCRKKVDIYTCRYIATPINFGVYRPYIILPKLALEKKELQYIFVHELNHIQQRDNLVQIFMTIMIIMNFYNPLAYYVLYKWKICAEICSDEAVIINKTEQEVKEYGKLIIDIAEDREESRLLPFMGFSIKKNQIKERIIYMKKEKNRKCSRITGAIAFVIALFVSSMSVFAYEPLQIDYTDGVVFKETEIECYALGEDKELLSRLQGTADEYKSWLPSEDGEIIILLMDGRVIQQKNEVQPYAVCRHSYESVKVVKHTKTGEGCRVDTYQGKRCQKCSNIVTGECTESAIYKKCPH